MLRSIAICENHFQRCASIHSLKDLLKHWVLRYALQLNRIGQYLSQTSSTLQHQHFININTKFLVLIKLLSLSQFYAPKSDLIWVLTVFSRSRLDI